MHFSTNETAILITGEVYSSPCIRARVAAGFGQRIMEVFWVQNPFAKWELALQPSRRAQSLHHLFFFSIQTKEQIIIISWFTFRASSCYTTLRKVTILSATEYKCYGTHQEKELITFSHGQLSGYTCTWHIQHQTVNEWMYELKIMPIFTSKIRTFNKPTLLMKLFSELLSTSKDHQNFNQGKPLLAVSI